MMRRFLTLAVGAALGLAPALALAAPSQAPSDLSPSGQTDRDVGSQTRCGDDRQACQGRAA